MACCEEVSWLFASSLSSSFVFFLFALKFLQFYLAIGIIGRWNNLHNTILLQDNTFRNISYIIEVIRK